MNSEKSWTDVLLGVPVEHRPLVQLGCRLLDVVTDAYNAAGEDPSFRGPAFEAIEQEVARFTWQVHLVVHEHTSLSLRDLVADSDMDWDAAGYELKCLDELFHGGDDE